MNQYLACLRGAVGVTERETISFSLEIAHYGAAQPRSRGQPAQSPGTQQLFYPSPSFFHPQKAPDTNKVGGGCGADPTAGTQLQAPAPGAREGLESPLPKGPCSVVSSPVLENLIFQAKKGKKIGQETDAISPAEGEAEARSSSAFSPSPKQTAGSPAAAW